jgi:hypothetical protein
MTAIYRSARNCRLFTGSLTRRAKPRVPPQSRNDGCAFIVDDFVINFDARNDRVVARPILSDARVENREWW